MASFTDAIPQFNPYIQQLPVDAMLAVGMEKQKRYDEGIQRIQSSIDQVAGLDIARDVDRQYLQSKLNDLGSKLRTVAAGDFSNFQLVNSTAGMASSIAKDQNVINSVQSTAQRRKLMERMQSDIEKGNYNPANEYIFNLTDSEWFNGTKVGEKYTGDYSTPIDVWGKIKDIAKEVGVDEKTIQQLYKTDSLGRIERNADGSPVWDNIMVEKTFKGKDASKILRAFENALTPADYKQLSIEGRYKYRGVTSEQLEQMIVSSTNQKIQFNNGKIETLKLALNDEKNKEIKDLEMIESLTDQIQFFEKQNRNFASSRDNGVSNAYSNPESVKASLFTDSYLANMSQALSSQDVSTKYSVNPMFEVSMKISEFNQKVKQWQAEFAILQAKEQREAELHPYKVAEAKSKLAESLTDPVQGVQQGVEDIDPATIVAMSNDQISQQTATLNDLNYKIALEAMKETNPIQPGETDLAYNRRLQEKLKEVAKVVDPNSGSVNTAVEAIAMAKLNEWNNNKNGVPPTMASTVRAQSDILKELTANQASLQSVRKLADERALLQGIDVEAQKKAMASIKPMTITLSGGRTLSLSPEDLVDVVNANARIHNYFGTTFMSKDEEKSVQKASERLLRKFGRDFSEVISKLYPKQSTTYTGLSTSPVPLPEVRQVAEILRTQTAKEYNKIYADVLVENGAIPLPMRYSVPQGDLKDSDYRNKINTVLQNYQSVFPDATQTALNSVMSGKFAASVNVLSGTATSPNKYYLQITNDTGESIPDIEISAAEYSSLTGNKAPLPSVVSGISQKLKIDGTTNMVSRGNFSTSYFNDSDFINFSSDKYSLRGDFEADEQNRNKAFFKLYLIDKNSGNLVDENWMRDGGEAVVFDVINDDGTPNPQILYTPNGFNKANVEMFFNRPLN